MGLGYHAEFFLCGHWRWRDPARSSAALFLHINSKYETDFMSTIKEPQQDLNLKVSVDADSDIFVD